MVSKRDGKMNIQDERTIRVIGEESFEKLQNKHVLIFGLGGVGGYVVEGLVRAGLNISQLLITMLCKKVI